MTTNSTTPVTTLFLGDAWSDPIEAGIRDRIRDFIEELIEEERAAARWGEDATNAGATMAIPQPSRRAMLCRFLVTGTAIASDSSPAFWPGRNHRSSGARWHR